MDDIKIDRIEVGNLVCVRLDVHLWSGRKRLRKEALIERNPALGDLPPESLATLGAIKICDPDDLAPFLSLKRKAEKLVHGNGLPLFGGWGVPRAKIAAMNSRLKEIRTDFDAARAQLELGFEARIQDWRTKPENAAWSHLIQDVPTPEHVAGRLSFGFKLSSVAAPADDDHSDLNESFHQEVGGLKGELFAEAARAAKALMETGLYGRSPTGVVAKREQITQKTLRPLRRLAEKMHSFAFLDSSVLPMAKIIEHCLRLMPDDGPIQGDSLMHIWTLARTLCNENAAQESALLAMSLGSEEEAFEQLIGAQATLSAAASPAVHAAAMQTAQTGLGQPDLGLGDAGLFGMDSPAAVEVQPASLAQALGDMSDAFF